MKPVVILCRVCLLFVALKCGIVFADNADDAAASDHMLAEITVSARKREETLERVPASLSVVKDSDLQSTYAGSLAALSSAAPNLVFRSVGEFGHSSSLDIRGVGGGVQIWTRIPRLRSMSMGNIKPAMPSTLKVWSASIRLKC